MEEKKVYVKASALQRVKQEKQGNFIYEIVFDTLGRNYLGSKKVSGEVDSWLIFSDNVSIFLEKFLQEGLLYRSEVKGVEKR